MRNKGNAKLRDEDVLAMRERLRLGKSTVDEEADYFGVARETIRKANRGETFRHISGGTTAKGLQASDDAKVLADAQRSAQEMYARHAAGELPAAVDYSLDPLAEAKRQLREAGAQASQDAPPQRAMPPSLFDGGELPPEPEAEAALIRLRAEAAKNVTLRAEGLLDDIAKTP
jgi:hypothetical protein